MIDHVTLNVADLAAARSFYAAALEPLGYAPAIEHDDQVGFVSPDRYPDFWLARRDPVGGSTHVAFRVADRATVAASGASTMLTKSYSPSVAHWCRTFAPSSSTSWLTSRRRLGFAFSVCTPCGVSVDSIR